MNTFNPRWDKDKAWAWTASHPWIVGCNFLPSYAVNFVDMWHSERYDPISIARELGWAASIGMNSVRVNLQYIQWKNDRSGQSRTFDNFLTIAQRYKIMVVPCLFDDCGFSGSPANADLQPSPRTDVHNGRALASPGREIVMDPTQWPSCLEFQHDVMSMYKDDARIVFWDVYNEPGNGAVFVSDTKTDDITAQLQPYSLRFLKEVFKVALDVNPTQPLTFGAWRDSYRDKGFVTNDEPFQNDIDQAMLSMSDIVSFHGYVSLQRMKALRT